MSATLSRATAAHLGRLDQATRWRCAVIVLALLAGGVGGLALGARASGPASEIELTHLLRAMAVLKLFFVAAASAAILWRMQAPVAWPKLAAYALACVAMTAGPGLIWYLAYLGPAAVLLHGGVAAVVLLLWRDEASGLLLDRAIARRRAARLR